MWRLARAIERCNTQSWVGITKVRGAVRVLQKEQDDSRRILEFPHYYGAMNIFIGRFESKWKKLDDSPLRFD